MANLIIGHASKTENSGITNGVAGDQTTQEVCTRSYYLHSKGWYALRPKKIEHANAIAEAMIRACKNDNIGYDQSGRLGIITYGTKSTVKTECDCSSLVRQCVIEGTGKDAGNFTTANEKTMLLATGLFEDAISVTSSTVLYNGDILVTKTKGHTAIVVSGNERIYSSQTTEKGENDNMLKGFDISKYQPTTLDFKSAKKAGYEFVLIRIGYNTTKDPLFESHYANAKAAGLKVGIYFYTTKLTINDGENDANRVLSWLGNKTLDFPIAYDMEESSMKSSVRKDTNSKQFNAFADVIRVKGFVPMLYTGAYMFSAYFNQNLITDPLWIADYQKNDGKNYGYRYVTNKVAIHQYTSAAIANDFYTAKLDRNQMMISYEELMKTYSKPSTPSTNTTPTTPSSNKYNSIVKAGQTHANNFAQCGLVCDGIYGAKTKQGGIKVLQHAMNLDYKAGLVEDGIWGAKSEKALGNHYVKRTETQYMVTALEILLMLKGYDPKGVELPGKFGSGLENSVKQYQKDKGLSQTGVADASTFKSLIS